MRLATWARRVMSSGGCCAPEWTRLASHDHSLCSDNVYRRLHGKFLLVLVMNHMIPGLPIFIDPKPLSVPYLTRVLPYHSLRRQFDKRLTITW